MKEPLHSRKQRELINKAWDYCMYWAQRTMGSHHVLEKNMKKDAKGRSCRQASKALIMSLGLHVYANNPTLQELEREEPEIIIGGLQVFRAIRSADSYGSNEELAKLITLCTEAVEIHRQAIVARIVEH